MTEHARSPFLQDSSEAAPVATMRGRDISAPMLGSAYLLSLYSVPLLAYEPKEKFAEQRRVAVGKSRMILGCRGGEKW